MIAQALSSSKKLLAFFNANTAGAQVAKFSDRKTAERRCALLAEELQAEKFSDAQIAAAITNGTALAHVDEQQEATQYPAGSLRAKLAEEIAAQPPIAARPKKDPATKTPRPIINAVRATFAGTSKMQEGSVRSAVLKAVQDAPEHTVTVAALDKAFNIPTRGYLQKLIEKGHLVVVDVQRGIEEQQ